MLQVHDRVFVGSERDCMSPKAGWSVVHACKSPCHQQAVGYRGSLKPDHLNYLVLVRGDELFLNLIDPPVPLFKPESFTAFMMFAHQGWQAGRSILIHCNQGESRAPSLALLLMAKRLRVLPDNAYADAAAAFIKLYPAYRPGTGISTFLAQKWGLLR